MWRERIVLGIFWVMVVVFFLLAAAVVVVQAADMAPAAGDYVWCIDRAGQHLRCFDGPAPLVRWMDRWLFGFGR